MMCWEKSMDWTVTSHSSHPATMDQVAVCFLCCIGFPIFFYSKCFRQNNSWNGRVKSVKSNSSSLWVHESSSHFKHMLWVQMRLCNAVYRRHLRRDHLSQVFGLCKIWKFDQISKKNFGCLHNTWNSQMIKVNSSNTIQIRMTDAISPEDEICIYRTDAGLKLDYTLSVQPELLHPIMAFSSAAAENTPTVGLQAAAATPSSATSSALLVQLQHLPGAPRLWQSVSWCVCVCGCIVCSSRCNDMHLEDHKGWQSN